MYKAEILADSLSPQGHRITTMKVTFPRIVLAEFNTHRLFSRNSASSRAIPFSKMVKMIQENPFIPIAWQKDHKGMQGTEYFTDKLSIQFAKSNWLTARDWAIKSAQSLNSSDNGYESVTKQLCNRLLEPFMWHTVIVTATEWENFFDLRCPQYAFSQAHDKIDYYKSKKDFIKAVKNYDIDQEVPETDLEWLQVNHSQADIHIQGIAELMWDAYNQSKPKQLIAGDWHIPMGDNIHYRDNVDGWSRDWQTIQREKVKIATARCARISYETLGDDPKIDYEADIRLHDRLINDGHMSPFEHCARVMSDEEYEMFINGKDTGEDKHSYVFNKESFGWCRNFKGFIQYRHIVESAN